MARSQPWTIPCCRCVIHAHVPSAGRICSVPVLTSSLRVQFYGFLGLFYLAIGFVWAVLCALYWKDILRVQLYISGVVLLNLMECIFYFAFYNDYNKTGVQCTRRRPRPPVHAHLSPSPPVQALFFLVPCSL